MNYLIFGNSTFFLRVGYTVNVEATSHYLPACRNFLSKMMADLYFFRGKTIRD